MEVVPREDAAGPEVMPRDFGRPGHHRRLIGGVAGRRLDRIDDRKHGVQIRAREEHRHFGEKVRPAVQQSRCEVGVQRFGLDRRNEAGTIQRDAEALTVEHGVAVFNTSIVVGHAPPL